MMIVDRIRPALWKAVGSGLLAVVAASIAVLWAWNTLGELYALPEMRFRHAFAVVLLAGTCGTILALGARRCASRHT